MIFNFPYHSFSTEYPDSGFRAALGNSYQFSAPPSAPDQRQFTLKFATMVYYKNAEGAGVDPTPNPKINFAVLEAFYNKHKLFAIFMYPHPVYGNVPCRFRKPLKVPFPKRNGGGSLEPFELELVEAPGMVETF